MDLKTAKTNQICDVDSIKQLFIANYMNFWNKTKEEAESFYESERLSYREALKEERIARCTKESLSSVFLLIAIKGLSIKEKYYAYIDARGIKNKTGGYDNVALFKITVFGELAERIRAGQIKYANDVVVVYEGDKIDVFDKGNGEQINYQKTIPRKSNNIILSYVNLIMPDGRIRLSYLEPEDIERLKDYSIKNNKGKGANELYTSNKGNIDIGFLHTKTIRKALKYISKDFMKKKPSLSVNAEEPEVNIVYDTDSDEDYTPDEINTQIETAVNEEETDKNDELPF